MDVVLQIQNLMEVVLQVEKLMEAMNQIYLKLIDYLNNPLQIIKIQDLGQEKIYKKMNLNIMKLKKTKLKTNFWKCKALKILKMIFFLKIIY